VRLSILAFHVSEIMTQPAGSKFTLSPCDGVIVDVEIKAGAMSARASETGWDQVYLNGRWMGNRAGGRDVFIQLVCQKKPAVQWD
jgi:hypothetical protein